MSFILPFTILIISYGLAYFFGRRFRYLIPKGKEFEVASACSIGIMVIYFMIKIIWFPSDKSGLFFTIGFGLASGFSSGMYNRKRK